MFQFRGNEAAHGADEPTGEWAWCRAEKVVSEHIRCPYGKPGDRLWVRESLKFVDTPTTRHDHAVYAADGVRVPRDQRLADWACDGMAFGFANSVPSIHMPRWASRITLEVTGVRVERLHSVSEADAAEEGVEFVDAGRTYWKDYLGSSTNCDEMTFLSARQSFSTLWNSINGAGAWAANPWVWVVEFKRIGA
ncbi:hypothetical protein PPGU19_011620 [Paraburkholderia sp. PGU19]|nr:hypothetical protein PPGU19_011620 [Paraburkholderia sp. PGU19]